MFRNPTTDLIVVLVIVLLILGPKRLPTLGRSIGHSLREFRDSITGDSSDSEHDERPEIARSSAATPTDSAAAAKPEPSDIGSERSS